MNPEKVKVLAAVLDKLELMEVKVNHLENILKDESDITKSKAAITEGNRGGGSLPTILWFIPSSKDISRQRIRSF